MSSYDNDTKKQDSHTIDRKEIETAPLIILSCDPEMRYDKLEGKNLYFRQAYSLSLSLCHEC